MENELINEGGFKYIEKGEGKPIIILHGLMGGLSNFEGVFYANVEDHGKEFCQIP